jgi:ribosomal protein S18 acetylase RimI-like enzyme
VLGAATIRGARTEDAAEVADLWTEAYVTLGVGGRVDPYSEADFAASAGDGEVLIAEDGGGIAGVVVLHPPNSPGRAVAVAAEAELSRLAVASAARRRGTGRALVDQCEGRARAAGWPAIALWSRPGQFEAHRLYLSTGYRRLPERDTVDATGHPRLAFLLDLEMAGANAQ